MLLLPVSIAAPHCTVTKMMRPSCNGTASWCAKFKFFLSCCQLAIACCTAPYWCHQPYSMMLVPIATPLPLSTCSCCHFPSRLFLIYFSKFAAVSAVDPQHCCKFHEILIAVHWLIVCIYNLFHVTTAIANCARNICCNAIATAPWCCWHCLAGSSLAGTVLLATAWLLFRLFSFHIFWLTLAINFTC